VFRAVTPSGARVLPPSAQIDLAYYKRMHIRLLWPMSWAQPTALETIASPSSAFNILGLMSQSPYTVIHPPSEVECPVDTSSTLPFSLSLKQLMAQASWFALRTVKREAFLISKPTHWHTDITCHVSGVRSWHAGLTCRSGHYPSNVSQVRGCARCLPFCEAPKGRH
jgi:hypothetical protein